MQGEIYTAAPKGKSGLQVFSEANLMKESPEYFVFNGAVDAPRKLLVPTNHFERWQRILQMRRR